MSRAAQQLEAFSRAGGQVLFGTDVGYIQQFDTSEEFTWMSRAGMSFQQILASLTTNPAQRFGYATHSGRIAKGLDADLVVLSADPAQNDFGIFKSSLHNPRWGGHLRREMKLRRARLQPCRTEPSASEGFRICVRTNETHTFVREPGRTADPSASLGMTKGRLVLPCSLLNGRWTREGGVLVSAYFATIIYGSGHHPLCHPERSRGICSAPRLPHKGVRFVSSHADSKAPEVRVSMFRSEQNPPCNNRTSAAKAACAQEVYGTAEAVPFVQRSGRREP